MASMPGHTEWRACCVQDITDVDVWTLTWLTGQSLMGLQDTIEHERLMRSIQSSLKDPTEHQPSRYVNLVSDLVCSSQLGQPDSQVDCLLMLREQLFLFRSPHRQADPDWKGLNTFLHEPGAFDGLESPAAYRAKAEEVITDCMHQDFQAMSWPRTHSMCEAMAERLLVQQKFKMLKPGQQLRYVPRDKSNGPSQQEATAANAAQRFPEQHASAILQMPQLLHQIKTVLTNSLRASALPPAGATPARGSPHIGGHETIASGPSLGAVMTQSTQSCSRPSCLVEELPSSSSEGPAVTQATAAAASVYVDSTTASASKDHQSSDRQNLTSTPKPAKLASRSSAAAAALHQDSTKPSPSNAHRPSDRNELTPSPKAAKLPASSAAAEALLADFADTDQTFSNNHSDAALAAVPDAGDGELSDMDYNTASDCSVSAVSDEDDDLIPSRTSFPVSLQNRSIADSVIVSPKANENLPPYSASTEQLQSVNVDHAPSASARSASWKPILQQASSMGAQPGTTAGALSKEELSALGNAVGTPEFVAILLKTKYCSEEVCYCCEASSTQLSPDDIADEYGAQSVPSSHDGMSSQQDRPCRELAPAGDIQVGHANKRKRGSAGTASQQQRIKGKKRAGPATTMKWQPAFKVGPKASGNRAGCIMPIGDAWRRAMDRHLTLGSKQSARLEKRSLALEEENLALEKETLALRTVLQARQHDIKAARAAVAAAKESFLELDNIRSAQRSAADISKALQSVRSCLKRARAEALGRMQLGSGKLP